MSHHRTAAVPYSFKRQLRRDEQRRMACRDHPVPGANQIL